MKKIICFFILFLLFSCEIQYDGERRFIVETTVNDDQNNPLKDIKIEVDAVAGTENSGDNISYANTDGNGYSIQIFPPRKNEGTFSIRINPNSGIYQSKVIYNINESDFQDYILKLGTVTLFKNEDITYFDIVLKQVSENVILKSLEIDAISSDSYVNYHEIEDEYFFPETSFHILKNQSFRIFYSVIHNTNPPTLSEHSVNISIGDEELIYELEY